MSYEIWASGKGTCEVKQNGTTVPGAHVKRIEFPEGHRNLPNGGRTYYPSGPAVGTVRLPDGTEVTNVPVKF
jgi:hypothetical protein